MLSNIIGDTLLTPAYSLFPVLAHDESVPTAPFKSSIQTLKHQLAAPHALGAQFDQFLHIMRKLSCIISDTS